MSVNNKKNKVVFTSNQKMCNFVSRMGMYLLLILVPLWMNKDMYTAMIGAKGKCVIFCFALMLLGIAVCYIYGFAVRERHIKFSVKNWEPMDYAVLAFGISIFLSFLGSSDKAACLTGSQGFHCGTFMCLSGIAFYFFLSRNMIPERSMWDMVFIVSDIIFAWVFCNSISFDILNMHAMIAEYQYFSYYGPLGNSNSISAYLCCCLWGLFFL